MNFFRLVTHLDGVFPVIAHLHRVSERLVGTRDKLWLAHQGAILPATEKWASAALLIDDAVAAIGLPGVIIDRAYIDRMDANHPRPWLDPREPKGERVVIPLVTNPGALEYARHEMVHMPAGSLWWVSDKVERMSCNWGTAPRYHLNLWLVKAENADVPVGTPEPVTG